MANREALREFQTRLASRLQAARTEGVSAAWLAVRAGAGRFLLPLAQAGEIFTWGNVQHVPYTQPWFLGVSNLRGGLYGVVDLAGFVSGGPANQDANRADARLVALNPALEVNCALLIDRLAGLRSADSFRDSAPAPAGAPDWLGPSHTDSEGEAWQEIDLQALSRQPDFLSISA
ncbi:MAG: chemotaxis protein CheW [Burkholderiaceae bacterium]|nr:chemotaxis protein CheW [Burkholderiaceae bacterium]MDO9090556.1 chemotaxis protein CheW [Burkholderiaceae bacterium]MDP1968784.1 chemotaxis protein CheW [Burkholderiaceae bacterium]